MGSAKNGDGLGESVAGLVRVGLEDHRRRRRCRLSSGRKGRAGGSTCRHRGAANVGKSSAGLWYGRNEPAAVVAVAVAVSGEAFRQTTAGRTNPHQAGGAERPSGIGDDASAKQLRVPAQPRPQRCATEREWREEHLFGRGRGRARRRGPDARCRAVREYKRG